MSTPSKIFEVKSVWEPVLPQKHQWVAQLKLLSCCRASPKDSVCFILQLRAALYDIHDIFFKMDITERMNILRHDREVRKEKMLRQLVCGVS